MTDQELHDALEQVEAALEECWDEAKGERRQFLLSACEAVAMAPGQGGVVDARRIDGKDKACRNIAILMAAYSSPRIALCAIPDYNGVVDCKIRGE